MPFINILSEKYKMKRNMAITLVLAIFFTFFISIILIIVPLIVKQFSEFINYFNENQELIQNKALSFISENNINLKTSINNSKNAIFSNIFKCNRIIKYYNLLNIILFCLSVYNDSSLFL